MDVAGQQDDRGRRVALTPMRDVVDQLGEAPEASLERGPVIHDRKPSQALAEDLADASPRPLAKRLVERLYVVQPGGQQERHGAGQQQMPRRPSRLLDDPRPFLVLDQARAGPASPGGRRESR